MEKDSQKEYREEMQKVMLELKIKTDKFMKKLLEQRIVFPQDLSSLTMSFSSLSSFSQVGQSLGSFDIMMISLMKMVFPIILCILIGKK